MNPNARIAIASVGVLCWLKAWHVEELQKSGLKPSSVFFQ
jgi:hypothetical protein